MIKLTFGFMVWTGSGDIPVDTNNPTGSDKKCTNVFSHRSRSSETFIYKTGKKG
jgi:hypothetical protein